MYILYPFLTHTAQTYNMLKETAFLTIYKLQYAMEEKIMHFNQYKATLFTVAT